MALRKPVLLQVAAAFLRLGLIAFGGPAAHLALMENEFVTRRSWISRQRFLDLMGATNLIPGPNSTEMAMHIGYERAGVVGLFVAGMSFVIPAAGITMLFAWAYLQFGSLPEVQPVLVGVRPAVLAVILGALWKLGRKAVSNWQLGCIAASVVLGVMYGLGEVLALLAGGLLGMIFLCLPRIWTSILAMGLILAEPGRALAASQYEDITVAKLGWFFLKVGAVLYGSGYVLVAFLEGGLVEDYGWLTQQQLLDAIAVGQFTPGPVLTAATFIGYILAGPAGAACATLAIFLPAIGFVWILNPLVHRLRKSPASAAFLDAINAAAVGLMAVVTLHLGQATLTTWPLWVIAVCAAAALFRGYLNAAWIVVGGGLIGWLMLQAHWL